MLILAAIGVNLSGIELPQFLSALVLLGVGWNFLYIGGSTLLTECYTHEEKAKVQGLNDFLVAGSMVVTAFSSGLLFSLYSWQSVNLAVVPLLLAVLAGVIWLGLRRYASAPKTGET